MTPRRSGIAAACLSATLALFAAATPARATVAHLADDAELLRRADLVVRAEAVANEVLEAGGRVFTDTEMRVLETLAGEPPERLVVRTLGGELPSGEGVIVWGAPRFEPGEELLLFLRAHREGTHRVVHFNQGVFRRGNGASGHLYLRDLSDSLILPDGPPRLAPDPGAARDAIRFADWIRDRATGAVRPADYVIQPPPEPTAASGAPVRSTSSPFSILRREGGYARWAVFDTAGNAVWHRNERGQEGLPARGEVEFRAAIGAWNGELNTPLRYIEGGTTPVDDAFARDGLNVIVFDDPNDDIGGDFCDGNAVIGGLGILVHGARVPGGWRGEDAWVIEEAGILINDGMECHPEFSSGLIGRLYSHELGHTLGLGHSTDGTGNFWAQIDAVMAPGGDSSGPGIRGDDARGLRFLYDPGYVEADCSVVGGPDYCTAGVCGTCGPGQGDCDSHAECIFKQGVFTRCAENVGAQYGFAPGVDVCVEGASGAPAVPTGLAAEVLGLETVRLSWNDESELETGYRVEQAAGGGAFATIANLPANAEELLVGGLLPGTVYSWRVRALNPIANSAPAGPVSVDTGSAVPAAPSDLTATPASATSVALSWTDNAGNEEEVVIEAASPVSAFAEVAIAGADATGIVIGGLTPDRPYTFRVSARNQAGASAPSGEASATPLADPTAPCVPGDETLCLLDGRFRVEVDWRNQFAGGQDGVGRVQPSPVAGTKSGVFSFFNPANIELIVKALDGTGLPANPAYWFFYGALSTVEYWITVTDVETGASRTYHNPPGELCGFPDTGAFPVDPAPAAAADPRSAAEPVRSTAAAGGTCVPDDTTICLAGGRFAATVEWTDQRTSQSGVGRAIPGSEKSGYFWFFNPQNVELVVKILDNSAAPAANWWVLYGGLSDVIYTLRIVDTETGLEREYVNEAGNFCGLADTQGFPDQPETEPLSP